MDIVVGKPPGNKSVKQGACAFDQCYKGYMIVVTEYSA